MNFTIRVKQCCLPQYMLLVFSYICYTSELSGFPCLRYSPMSSFISNCLVDQVCVLNFTILKKTPERRGFIKSCKENQKFRWIKIWNIRRWFLFTNKVWQYYLFLVIFQTFTLKYWFIWMHYQKFYFIKLNLKVFC